MWEIADEAAAETGPLAASTIVAMMRLALLPVFMAAANPAKVQLQIKAISF
jgi:hypothetical protein